MRSGSRSRVIFWELLCLWTGVLEKFDLCEKRVIFFRKLLAIDTHMIVKHSQYLVPQPMQWFRNSEFQMGKTVASINRNSLLSFRFIDLRRSGKYFKKDPTHQEKWNSHLWISASLPGSHIFLLEILFGPDQSQRGRRRQRHPPLGRRGRVGLQGVPVRVAVSRQSKRMRLMAMRVSAENSWWHLDYKLTLSENQSSHIFDSKTSWSSRH